MVVLRILKYVEAKGAQWAAPTWSPCQPASIASWMKGKLKGPAAIIINSLYTKKEVFIREIISNASDAIDKRRQTNLLEALNLPTKRPFKKMFMNEDDKKIYSMV